ncbi:MAG: hypothetical protein ACPG5B_11190 [Chitinophagales bacterium]
MKKEDFRRYNKCYNSADKDRMSIKEITQSGDAIQVTAAKYDNIGQILGGINVAFSEYNTSETPQMLFLNCGSETKVKSYDIRTFVENGGTLYASDLTNELLENAFPNIFKFKTNGKKGEVAAEIVDSELKSILGRDMKVHFDLGNWAVLHSISKGKVLMKNRQTQQPLMVAVPYGRGKIYYTCFHNHKQPSKKEQDLLKLLVAKQVADLTERPLAETAQEMGIDVSKIKDRSAY